MASAADADGAPEQIVITGTRVSATMDASTTTSRLGLTVWETPASVEIIDGEAIRARGDRSIVEAVTRGTGITSVATPGNGLSALAARGFSGHGSVALLLDGIRLYPGSGTLAFPFHIRTVERIEVLRAPASVLSGEGAIGGAINIVSKAPATLPQRAALIGYGSDGLARVAGGAGLTSGSWGARVDARLSARTAARVTAHQLRKRPLRQCRPPVPLRSTCGRHWRKGRPCTNNQHGPLSGAGHRHATLCSKSSFRMQGEYTPKRWGFLLLAFGCDQVLADVLVVFKFKNRAGRDCARIHFSAGRHIFGGADIQAVMVGECEQRRVSVGKRHDGSPFSAVRHQGRARLDDPDETTPSRGQCVGNQSR